MQDAKKIVLPFLGEIWNRKDKAFKALDIE